MYRVDRMRMIMIVMKEADILYHKFLRKSVFYF